MSGLLLIKQIEECIVPHGSFALWFLGQNSFILKGHNGFTMAIDPYLSDWCARQGKNIGPTPYSRLYPPPILPSELSVDAILLTHSHCDHADPETLSTCVKNPRINIIGSWDAIQLAQSLGFQQERLHLIHAGEEFFVKKENNNISILKNIESVKDKDGIAIKATFSLPTDQTDLNHIGFLCCFDGNATFWNTGDTAWCDTLPLLTGKAINQTLTSWNCTRKTLDVITVCINAGYGNLSHWDAARLVGGVGCNYAIPCHWDLFPHNSLHTEPFKTSLDINAPNAVYTPIERETTYICTGSEFSSVINE